jgi:hypothetical protein
MTGWNMPPGCNERDIPGNRPEDEEEEAFINSFLDFIATLRTPNNEVEGAEIFELIALWCFDRVGDAYADGYQDGLSNRETLDEIKGNNDDK